MNDNKYLRISDIQDKDIINIKTGEKIGNIIDLEVNIIDGSINKIMLYEKKKIISIFNKQSEDYIKWEDIKKIGGDVILVDKTS